MYVVCSGTRVGSVNHVSGDGWALAICWKKTLTLMQIKEE